jgi:hypothetical protein
VSTFRRILSAFFNLRLRRGVEAVTIENQLLLQRLAPVFDAAEALSFLNPVLRGGAVRDGLLGKEVNDYDLYVSRAQVAEGLQLPSVRSPNAAAFYASWLQSRLGKKDLKAHQPRVVERPYLSFNVELAGIDHPVDLVINDEVLSPEMLALEADATMNAIAASRDRIAAHPLFERDTERHIYRPTCARLGNLICAPQRYRKKFARRDGKLAFRLF